MQFIKYDPSIKVKVFKYNDSCIINSIDKVTGMSEFLKRIGL